MLIYNILGIYQLFQCSVGSVYGVASKIGCISYLTLDAYIVSSRRHRRTGGYFYSEFTAQGRKED